jgi:hypothetical protein
LERYKTGQRSIREKPGDELVRELLKITVVALAFILKAAPIALADGALSGSLYYPKRSKAVLRKP